MRRLLPLGLTGGIGENSRRLPFEKQKPRELTRCPTRETDELPYLTCERGRASCLWSLRLEELFVAVSASSEERGRPQVGSE